MVKQLVRAALALAALSAAACVSSVPPGAFACGGTDHACPPPLVCDGASNTCVSAESSSGGGSSTGGATSGATGSSTTGSSGGEGSTGGSSGGVGPTPFCSTDANACSAGTCNCSCPPAPPGGGNGLGCCSGPGKRCSIDEDCCYYRLQQGHAFIGDAGCQNGFCDCVPINGPCEQATDCCTNACAPSKTGIGPGSCS